MSTDDRLKAPKIDGISSESWADRVSRLEEEVGLDVAIKTADRAMQEEIHVMLRMLCKRLGVYAIER